jgi:hypothetical protein
MIVYGDRVRVADAHELIDRIGASLEQVAGAPAGIGRHEALVSCFIDASGLLQGLADAEFDSRGVDDCSPLQDAATALLMDLAQSVRRSWASGFRERGPPTGRWRDLKAFPLPASIRVNQPEGYAFYALYPESYVEAAAALASHGWVRVIGIRSIGAGLAALVATAAGAPPPVTLRPVGHPFQREVRLSDRLADALLAEHTATFAIVDEGPGLSGSSFGAVADFLEDRGLSPERIHFFPSHRNDLGPQACERHRRRWRHVPRPVVEFDDLLLHPAEPAHRLQTWLGSLVGDEDARLDDISAGAWRRQRYEREADWPPSYVPQEKRKFLLHGRGGPWLARFAGLGRDGAGKLVFAKALHAAGFAPEPRGYRHGFLVERWIADAQPLDPGAVDRAWLIGEVSRYLVFRARTFPASRDDGASLQKLFEMARYNSEQALGPETATAFEPWLGCVSRLESLRRPIRTDNRLHAWEWLVLPDGKLLKTDALDHHASHDLIGCQDVTWDIAGATVELGLSPDETSELCRIVAHGSGIPVDRELLALSERCYLAFQLGYWSMAADAVAYDPQEAARARSATASYAARLRSALAGAFG